MHCWRTINAEPSQASNGSKTSTPPTKSKRLLFTARECVFVFFCTHLFLGVAQWWHMQMGQWNSNLNHNSMRKRCVCDLRRSIRSGISLTCCSDRSILVELWRMRAQLWGIYIYTQWSLHRMMMMIVIWSDDWTRGFGVARHDGVTEFMAARWRYLGTIFFRMGTPWGESLLKGR